MKFIKIKGNKIYGVQHYKYINIEKIISIGSYPGYNENAESEYVVVFGDDVRLYLNEDEYKQILKEVKQWMNKYYK